MVESNKERLGAPLIKALGIHLLVAMLLFVSFSKAPEFEPAKPIVQATLVQLNSKSPATTQTEQRIAGEAERTAAQRHEAEELAKEQQKRQQEQEAARAAEQQRQAEQREAAAAAERAAQEQKAAEERRQAEQVERQKAEEARRAEAARRLAEEEAKKKAAEEEAKKKAAEEARKREEEARRRAAEEAKRKQEAEAKAEAERVARLQREQEEARARALADLLAEETQYQRAQADQIGDQVAASYDDVIRRYVSEQWRRPPTARNGMVVEVRISMLPTGDITDVVVLRSSGDVGFDQSAVQAVRNVGRIPEMQQLSRENPAAFDRMYRQRTLRFKPEDLDF